MSDTEPIKTDSFQSASWAVFLKGIFMGTADIIPGVSGGTMALILGIYEQLIDAVRSINLRWFFRIFTLMNPFAHHGQTLRQQIRSLGLDFLVPLGGGIFSAILIGSQFLPPLLANYPSLVRAFFFGLIFSGLWVPLRWVKIDGRGNLFMVAILLTGGIGLGFYLTDPAHEVVSGKQWVEVSSSGKTMDDLLRKQASALPAQQVFWASENQSLQQWIKTNTPDVFEKLPRPLPSKVADRERLKARSAPFQEINLPEGILVSVPRLRPEITVLVGFIAICAMVLPGISGSYILLILGGYFFVLNLLKGGIHQISSGSIPTLHLGYIGLFAVGAIAGLAVFSRILHFLLERAPSVTMAFLTGIMAGCLRGIWPFRIWDGGWINVLPSPALGTWLPVLICFTVGVLSMLILYWMEAYRKAGLKTIE